jgi:hypothetical protein
VKLSTEFRSLAPDAERWACINDDEYDGAPDAGAQMVGYGPTEQPAKDDFMDQWMEREAERDPPATPRRLSADELFPGGRLEPIGDRTIDLHLDEAQRATLRRQADEGYQAATADEMLQLPESI